MTIISFLVQGHEIFVFLQWLLFETVGCKPIDVSLGIEHGIVILEPMYQGVNEWSFPEMPIIDYNGGWGFFYFWTHYFFGGPVLGEIGWTSQSQF